MNIRNSPSFTNLSDLWGKSIEIVSTVVADTGMRGESVMGPMCPASQSGTSCPDKPYQATIIVRDRLG